MNPFERVHCVTAPELIQFDGRQPKAIEWGDREGDHRAAVERGRNSGTGLVRRRESGNEMNFIDSKRAGDGFGCQKMPDMDGIECPTEYGYPHETGFARDVARGVSGPAALKRSNTS
jgi:hypothetical protein